MYLTKELEHFNKSQIGRTLVITEKGEWEVSTVRLTHPVARLIDSIFGFADITKTPYETIVFKCDKGKRVSNVDHGHVRYCLKEDAVQGHGRLVEGIRRGKIVPRQAPMEDFDSLCSPWCSVKGD